MSSHFHFLVPESFHKKFGSCHRTNFTALCDHGHPSECVLKHLLCPWSFSSKSLFNACYVHDSFLSISVGLSIPFIWSFPLSVPSNLCQMYLVDVACAVYRYLRIGSIGSD